MGKKEKNSCALADDFQVVTSLVPKLESFIKVHKEIMLAYQKYRKNDGAAIPGLEKHLGLKKETNAASVKTKETPSAKEVKVPKAGVEAKKAKKIAKV